MLELSPRQLAVLEQLRVRGFTLVAFAMYENYVGVKKANCAALLAPAASGGLQVFGEPCYLIGGHLSVRLRREGRDSFVWKKEALETTPARLVELSAFSAALAESLIPSA